MTTQFTESVMLFAMDAKTGQQKWSHPAEKSIRNNTVAIGGGRVYLIDRALASEPPRRSKEIRPHPTGVLRCLDAQSGKALWSTDEDVYGTVLQLSVKHNVLLMCYQPTRFRLGSEFGGRHMQYEKFYAGPAHVMNLYSFFHCPWGEFKGLVEEILSGYDAP